MAEESKMPDIVRRKEKQTKRRDKRKGKENRVTVAMYRRVSTQEQATGGLSIEFQKDVVERHVRGLSHFADKEVELRDYADPGHSAKDLDRPAVRDLLRDIERGMIQFVAIYKLDRFSRNNQEILWFIDHLDRLGIGLISVSEDLNTKTATGRAMISIMGTIAQLEREQVSERVKFVLDELVKKRPAGGQTPFGYVYINRGGDDRMYVPYTREYQNTHGMPYFVVGEDDCPIWPGEVVQKIFEWFRTERSYQRVVDRLKEWEIPVPRQMQRILKEYEKGKAQVEYLRVAKPKKWSRATVKRVIDNPVYTGNTRYNRYSNRLKSYRNPDDQMWIEGTHEALVAEEQYESCAMIGEEISRY